MAVFQRLSDKTIVNAQQLAQFSYHETMAWCQGRPAFRLNVRGPVGVYVPTIDGDILANLGDWIVKGPDGAFSVSEHVKFLQQHKEMR